jgi:hypothetical protein
LTSGIRSFSLAIFDVPDGKSARRFRKSRHVDIEESAPALARCVLCFRQEGLFHRAARVSSEIPPVRRVPIAAEMLIFFSAPAQRFFDGTINAF